MTRDGPGNSRTLGACVLVLSRLGKGTDRVDTGSESAVREIPTGTTKRKCDLAAGDALSCG